MSMQTNALSASSTWSTAAAPRRAKADLETDRPLVLIVDDDEDIRSALRELLLSVGIDASCFASTRELLHADLEDRPRLPDSRRPHARRKRSGSAAPLAIGGDACVSSQSRTLAGDTGGICRH
jgi:hypothetical protein